MGTRADFYLGRGKAAEWLGSVAFDGYPDNILDGTHLGSAATPEEFRAALSEGPSAEDHWTNPEQGWPWPWEDSGTTDFAYALDESRVWVSCFGGPWMTVGESLMDSREREELLVGRAKAVFPDMKDRQAVTFGKRSGLIIVGA